jgi:hypothetical protein
MGHVAGMAAWDVRLGVLIGKAGGNGTLGMFRGKWEDKNKKRILTFQGLAVTLHTTRFSIKKFYVVLTLRLCVLYGSQNKQQLLPYKTLRDWFLYPKWRVFTARYVLSPYIKQIRFVFKGLKKPGERIWNGFSFLWTKSNCDLLWSRRRIFRCHKAGNPLLKQDSASQRW